MLKCYHRVWIKNKLDHLIYLQIKQILKRPGADYNPNFESPHVLMRHCINWIEYVFIYMSFRYRWSN